MHTRSEYVEQLKNKLDQWNADISKWEAKARAAQTDMRIEYEMQLDAVRKHREHVTDKLKALQTSGEGAWQDLSVGADAALAAMRDAFEKAASHFRK